MNNPTEQRSSHRALRKRGRKTRGRATLLTPPLQKKICALLAQGSAIKSACIVAAGLGERTYHDWNQRGKNGEEPFATFFSAATRAREQHKARLIQVVMQAAHKDARHAEWLLERQFPAEFARNEARAIIVERPPVPVSPPKPPLPQTTTYWTTTGHEIPFTKDQLKYISQLRAAYRSNGKEQNQ
jgi:hypothetical protein